MADTLLLDRDAWDLCRDASGNIALARPAYAILQDVASACQLFAGELYYGGDQGISYFDRILGHYQPLQILKAQLIAAARTVPGVISAKVFLTAVKDRAISGQVQVVTSSGTLIVTL